MSISSFLYETHLRNATYSNHTIGSQYQVDWYEADNGYRACVLSSKSLIAKFFYFLNQNVFEVKGYDIKTRHHTISSGCNISLASVEACISWAKQEVEKEIEGLPL